MKRAIRDKALPILSHWLMLVITGILFVLVATFVDLKPVVDQNFSFQPMTPEFCKPKKSSDVFHRSRK